LPAAAASYLHDRRSGVTRADLVGGHLPYGAVEARVQSALLP
jgi:hypothetical protein